MRVSNTVTRIVQGIGLFLHKEGINEYKPFCIKFTKRKVAGEVMSEIKIRNFISINGAPEVLFDALPREKQKEVAEKLQENAMIPAGFRRVKRDSA